MVVFTLDSHGPWGCPACPPGPEDAVPEQLFLLWINKSTFCLISRHRAWG